MVRSADRRADRRSAGLPAACAPARRQDQIQQLDLGVIAGADRSGARPSNGSLVAPNSLEGVGLSPVRQLRRQQHRRRLRLRCRGHAVKGTDKGAGDDGRLQQPLLSPSIPTSARCCAVAEAARNLACVGAEPIGVTDCLNFGSPEKPEVMWQFSRGRSGLRDACLAFETFRSSAATSASTTRPRPPIPPTPTIGMVGLLDDVESHRHAMVQERGRRDRVARPHA